MSRNQLNSSIAEIKDTLSLASVTAFKFFRHLLKGFVTFLSIFIFVISLSMYALTGVFIIGFLYLGALLNKLTEKIWIKRM